MAYNLPFISDDDLFKHVAETVSKYRFSMDLAEFNKNLIDPIKLTFDAKIYNKSIADIVENEVIRQIDKSNTNHIGYFHQNIFRYMGNGWHIPTHGFDLINEEEHIFVEMKNKHNTMNSASSQKTYMKMQSKLLEDDQAVCYLVEIIAKHSQDAVWQMSLDGKKFNNNRIRRVSIDKFYAQVTGQPQAFKQLCDVLPQVIADAVAQSDTIHNTVNQELAQLDPNLLRSLYQLAFHHYEGFGTATNKSIESST